MKRKNIDRNTKAVSFKSVAAAKRYAKAEFGHLPRVGYEMTMVCDCGHLSTKQKADSCGTGYGKDRDGKTHCYACCTKRDKADLKTAQRTGHYVDGDGKLFINWAGRKLGRVLYWGEIHPWSHARGSWLEARRYVRIRDCHGQEWYGVASPGMYAVLRKCKVTSR